MLDEILRYAGRNACSVCWATIDKPREPRPRRRREDLPSPRSSACVFVAPRNLPDCVPNTFCFNNTTAKAPVSTPAPLPGPLLLCYQLLCSSAASHGLQKRSQKEPESECADHLRPSAKKIWLLRSKSVQRVYAAHTHPLILSLLQQCLAPYIFEPFDKVAKLGQSFLYPVRKSQAVHAHSQVCRPPRFETARVAQRERIHKKARTSWKRLWA